MFDLPQIDGQLGKPQTEVVGAENVIRVL